MSKKRTLINTNGCFKQPDFNVNVLKNLQREEDLRQIDQGTKSTVLITPDRLHKKRARTGQPSPTPTKNKI